MGGFGILPATGDEVELGGWEESLDFLSFLLTYNIAKLNNFKLNEVKYNRHLANATIF